MALPFDSNALAPAERPSTEALNRGFSASHAALDFFYRQTLAQRTSASNDRAILRDGFLGDAFCTRAVNPASMFVEVAAGLGFRYDPADPLVAAQDSIVGVYQGVSDLSPFRPLVLPQAVNIPVPPAPLVGQSRYDLIEVRPKRELADYGNLLRFNFGTLQWAPQSAAAFLRYAIEPAEVAVVAAPALSTAPLSYVQGVPAATGTQVEPAGTPGYVKVARILVTGGDTSIAQNRILDYRLPLTQEDGLTINGSVDINTTVNLPNGTPTIRYLSTPPSIKAAVVSNVAANAEALFVVLVPKFVRGISGTFTAYDGASSPSTPLVLWGTSVEVVGTVGITLTQALLADPALTSPTLSAADGQKLAYVSVMVRQFNPATQLFNEVLPAVVGIDFRLHLLV